MNMTAESRSRWSFAGFVLSPAQRILLDAAREVPLIPRYFDLLCLLIERRGEAIHRREILDAVWSDVVVTDGALSQAIRTLRRALGDDPRNPVFIRTVPRHGYQFVFADVVEEPDTLPLPRRIATPDAPGDEPIDKEGPDPFETALQILLADGGTEDSIPEDERRDAAETLHRLGTAEALRRLRGRPGRLRAQAILRDVRWDLPDSGSVPLLGQPGGLVSLWILFGLRIRRALRLAGGRWLSSAVGGALAGGIAGAIGGVALRFGPGSSATNSVLVALPVVGLTIGGLAALGVGAGLASAEALVRSARGRALVFFGSLGGGLVGAVAHLLGQWTLEGLFGGDLSPVAGGFEGFVLGAAVGLGYALATPTPGGGMATPRGRRRARVAVIAGLATAGAGALLGLTGSHLGAMSLDFMARSFPDSQVALDPLARILGEEAPGLMTRTAISAWEGLMFGSGLIAGLTRRPGTAARR